MLLSSVPSTFRRVMQQAPINARVGKRVVDPDTPAIYSRQS